MTTPRCDRWYRSQRDVFKYLLVRQLDKYYQLYSTSYHLHHIVLPHLSHFFLFLTNLPQVGIGGKGQDVFVASVSMKASPPPLLLQFLGSGAEGDALSALIQKMACENSVAGDDSSALSVRTAASCRTCVTLVDPVKEEATEIVEPSG